jgi:hypothetical protein
VFTDRFDLRRHDVVRQTDQAKFVRWLPCDVEAFDEFETRASTPRVASPTTFAKATKAKWSGPAGKPAATARSKACVSMPPAGFGFGARAGARARAGIGSGTTGVVFVVSIAVIYNLLRMTLRSAVVYSVYDASDASVRCRFAYDRRRRPIGGNPKSLDLFRSCERVDEHDAHEPCAVGRDARTRRRWFRNTFTRLK